MSRFFADNNYQAPQVYIDIMGVQLGLADITDSNGIDITASYIRPVRPSSLVKFPNVIVSMKVKKLISGEANMYTINLKYAPQEDEDPSFIDKLISANRTSNDSKIIIAYGDASKDGYFGKKYEATILNYTMSAELETSSSNYVITAVSSASTLLPKDKDNNTLTFQFSAKGVKYISQMIRNIYNNPDYKFKDLFPGGIRIDDVDINDNNLINNPPDIKLESSTLEDTENKYNPLQYLIKLVSLMVSKTIGTESAIKYGYAYNDEYGNRSFEIYRMLSSEDGGDNSDYSDELIVNGQNSNVISYSMTTDYANGMVIDYGDRNNNSANYYYEINDQGEEVIRNVKDKSLGSTADADRAWYEAISKFPVGLNLVVQAMKTQLPLFSKIKVFLMIRGRAHYSSGIYMLTDCEDNVDQSGYLSNLKLLKVSQIEYNG